MSEWEREHLFRQNLGRAMMCMKVNAGLRKVEQDHPWTMALREVLEPRSWGQFDVVINEEIPPDRVVFVGNDGEVIATVILEQQEEQ